MAAEMPAKVEPVDGADNVDFPWGPASTAVTALNQAASTLGTQLDTRADMAPSIADWTGTFRTDFDTAHTGITTTASGLKDTLTRVAYWIVGGAEAANQQQRTNNDAVAHQPVP
jgi:hypothetical protein